MKKTINKETSGFLKGVGLAAAAAAGAYFLYGAKDSKKNRQAVKSWAFKVKAEVLEKLEDLKAVDEEKYNDIVDAVTEKYKTLKKINQKDLKAISKEMKGHWQSIKKELGVRK
ncbi:MAG: hypothetical protein WCI52_00360 [bacterium]